MIGDRALPLRLCYVSDAHSRNMFPESLWVELCMRGQKPLIELTTARVDVDQRRESSLVKTLRHAATTCDAVSNNASDYPRIKHTSI